MTVAPAREGTWRRLAGSLAGQSRAHGTRSRNIGRELHGEEGGDGGGAGWWPVGSVLGSALGSGMGSAGFRFFSYLFFVGLHLGTSKNFDLYWRGIRGGPIASLCISLSTVCQNASCSSVTLGLQEAYIPQGPSYDHNISMKCDCTGN